MTTVSSRVSNSLLAGAALCAIACVDHQSLDNATTSLKVTVTAPTDLGSADNRLPDGNRQVTLEISALDEQGQPDTTLNADLDLYVHFLGTLTPEEARHVPFQKVTMKDGVATAQLALDAAFGPTIVWAEDVNRDGATFATGVSPDVWFREPFLDDVGRPANELGLDALSHSPLEGKQVTIASSHFGADGELVVTGVYAQGYTVSDVKKSDKTTPPYGHGFIFTFGRPRAADGRVIEVGHVVKLVSGGISEFLGFTEFNFPRTELTAAEADVAHLPTPAKLDETWLAKVIDPNGMINLERLESGLVVIEDATVCDVAGDSEFTRFAQWKVTTSGTCGNGFRVITKGQVSNFDPAKFANKKLPRLVGTLKHVFTGSQHIWIVLPRSIDDIQTPQP